VLVRIRKERRRGASYNLIADGLNADRIRTKRGGRWYAATGAATGGLLGAGIGAGAGAALGAILGAFIGRAGQGAALGAAVGGASGGMEGAAAGGVSQRRLEMNAYGACMAGRGYLVRW
jgi:hypothetical protein